MKKGLRSGKDPLFLNMSAVFIHDVQRWSKGTRIAKVGGTDPTFSHRAFLQARVTLARAVYSSALVLLLDDIFAALDVHTYVFECHQLHSISHIGRRASHIVERCFLGDLIHGRTILIVVCLSYIQVLRAFIF